MPSANTLPIYRACVENFREIESARRQFEKSMNGVLRSRPAEEIEKFTCIYSILFSSWAESRLLKLVYTPHGFEDSEISEVLKQGSVEEKWKKTVEIGLTKLKSTEGKVANYKRMIHGVIATYITEPALLRNKYAHGQWKVALNHSGDGVNHNTTELMRIQTAIDVSNWFYFFGRVSDLIEVLIESPRRAFQQEYWAILAEIEDEQRSRMGWRIEDKINKLRRKHESGGRGTATR